MVHRPSLTHDEFFGFASCLAQLTHVQVVRQGQAGPVDLTHEEFVAALAAMDTCTAEKAARWLAAMVDLRSHVMAIAGAEALPAEPFRVGTCGHVM